MLDDDDNGDDATVMKEVWSLIDWFLDARTQGRAQLGIVDCAPNRAGLLEEREGSRGVQTRSH